MLHTVNKSPFSAKTLEQALRFIKDGEPLLLLEDGVYAVLAGTSSEKIISNLVQKNPVYAISADIKARGIEQIIDGVQVIDYGKFVDLVAENTVNNWL